MVDGGSGVLAEAEVAQFRADGFVAFERFVDGGALEDLRADYDRVLSKEVDCGENDRQLGGITRQIMLPSVHLPSIRQNPAFAKAKVVAAELLGCDEAVYGYDMMIYKPPGHPEETPWHQDLGYFQMPFSPAGRRSDSFTVQFWIAVDDAAVETGCMHFVPGVHEEPMREHYIHSGDVDYEGRLLAMRDPETVLDLSTAVPCPLPAGGATAHLEGTPHYTPANTSRDRHRRAYIVNFNDPTRLRAYHA